MGDYYFSPYQIAEMAMGVEDAGVIFYDRLATLVEDGELKDIFTALSKAELSHKDSFRSIADSLLKEDLNKYSVDLPMLMQVYIDKLKKAAFNMQTFSKKPTCIQEAIGIAVHTEKEAIGIFTEMQNTFIEKFHEVLSVIIEEEKKHLSILGEVEARLKSNSDIR